MRPWLVASLLALALVAACGGSTSPAPVAVVASDVPPPPPAQPVEAPRDDDSVDGKSVTLLRFGDVAFAADGAPVQRGSGRMPWQPERRLVTGVSETRVQIETVEHGARLSLWVEREDLATVPIVATRLAVWPNEVGSTAGEGGVTVFEGTPLRVVQRGDGIVRVDNDLDDLVDQDLVIEGWLEAAKLGTFYVARAREPSEVPTDSRAHVVGGTVLWDAPGGREIGRFRSDADWQELFEVELLGAERDHHTQVAFRSAGLTAVGWVVSPVDNAGGLGIGGIGAGGGLEVPPGTCLHASEGGAAVGEAVEVIEIYGLRASADDAWLTGELFTPWGKLPVWVHAVNDGYARCDGGVALTAAIEAADDDAQ